MKKNIILALAFGLFLFSCQNSNKQPEIRSGKSETNVSAQVSAMDILCLSYSIFNPQSPMGYSVGYSYLDCDGVLQSEWLNPGETVSVLAQEGTVKCPGGVVTPEKGSKTDSEKLKP
jgi:hypothetical protein